MKPLIAMPGCSRAAPRSPRTGAGIASRTGSLVTTLLAAATLASSADAASISGLATLQGAPPARPTITMTADPACDRLHPQGRAAEVVVADASGSLANVIVWVSAGLPKDYRPPAVPQQSAVIDQNGCAYVPHVIAVRAGQEVEIRNSDPTLHNVHARSTENVPFNDAMPMQGQVIRKSFVLPEVAVKLKCDIHPWMAAYVGVFPHPFFAVTGPDGRFTLSGLPEGDYTIEAWHESLGRRSVKVEIDDEEDAATADFFFAGN